MLTNIIFLPIVGAIFIAIVLRKDQRTVIKYTSLFFSGMSFLFSLYLLPNFDYISGAFVCEERYQWIPSLGISYHLGLDSLSLALVILNGLLTVISILSSFTAINKHERAYYSLLLILQAGINGTFMALDLVLFYIFWEVMLLPLYFLIGIWGSENRIYATMKFVLFTLTGSVLMLLAILSLYFQSRTAVGPAGTFDFTDLRYIIANGSLKLKPNTELYLFLAFFLAFAIKVPLFPFHTWLPDAHTEAPTAGSVILAGVLLKTGVYGIMRFCIPLFPNATKVCAPFILWLSAIAIIYGAMTAIAQKDMKRLIAYSSVSHMGFIILGLFAFNEISVQGAILQMINHGISTGGLFLCVGLIYERRHTRLMKDFGGLAQNLKIYAVLTVIIVLSSAGLPGLNGFIGEFTILLGTFKMSKILAIVGALGIVFGAVYLLIMVQRVFFGPLDNPKNKEIKDLNFRETLTLLPLILIAFLIGLWASPFLNFVKAPSRQIVKIIHPNNASSSNSTSQLLKK